MARVSYQSAKEKNLDEELYIKLVATSQLANQKAMQAAPLKKQMNFADIFKSK